jgi:hypothetical protein
MEGQDAEERILLKGIWKEYDIMWSEGSGGGL